MGTLIGFEPPAPHLQAELRLRGHAIDLPTAQAAIRAEITYYRAHLDEGTDADSLLDLRRRCAVAMGLDVPPNVALAALLASLRFFAYPDSAAALLALRERGFRLVVVSNWDWSLHERLKQDTIDIGDLPLSRVLVIKDAHYPWLLLVPRRSEIVEIIDLEEVEQAQLMTEISRVARALKEITKCDKLNIAALGNVVPQLHVHIIARRTGDAAWPRPVWGVMPPLAHDAEEVQRFISALRRKIWLAPPN